jgi:hypothetical protein
MTTKFFWHEQNQLVATLTNQELPDYLTLHPALPAWSEWIQLVPGPATIPLHNVQGVLMDRGAEPIVVFRAKVWPVEVMKWPGGLVYLVATLKECLARHHVAHG